MQQSLFMTEKLGLKIILNPSSDVRVLMKMDWCLRQVGLLHAVPFCQVKVLKTIVWSALHQMYIVLGE